MRKSLVLASVLALSAVALTGCGSDDSDTDPTPQDPQAVSVAEARAQAADSEATVEGHVTVAPGAFNSAIGDQGFAIQDDTGGIYVSLPDRLDASLGARVRITGRLAQVAHHRPHRPRHRRLHRGHGPVRAVRGHLRGRASARHGSHGDPGS